MSLIGYHELKVFAVLVILCVTEVRPRPQENNYLPPSSPTQGSGYFQNPTFFIPPAQQQQQQPSASVVSPSNQQQFLTQPPIQLQIPIPNDGVQEKKIYVQLPPQQYPQQPQYRYPPRKHYKIILVRSPSPTPPPAPVLPEIEEQTLVYVLVKKPDSPNTVDLQQQQQQSFKLNKPEVYFIKYKANDENTNGSVPADTIEKSIQHQISNNIEGGLGYSYDDKTRNREARKLNQQDEEDAKIVENKERQ